MKKLYYPSPLKSGLSKDIDYGDPFIYRFNGEYYLFATGANPIKTQGHVYKTKDLINYTYLGQFSDDEVAKGAFAPEIIYAYSYFYLATSPLGKGHYIFRSKNIEGPYERITDNIGLLIDGSFCLDKDNKLHFLYASRRGIMMCEMDKDGNTKDHHLISSSLSGWTEGGSIVQRGEKYYLFYCGNHFQAKGYRINCAVSDNIEGPYLDIKNNPILIDTDTKYTRLGHSSETISTDLSSRLIMYHTKRNKEAPRQIFLSKIRFYKDNVAISHSDIYRSEFALPTYENRDIKFNNEFCLSNKKMNVDVNIEGFINEGINLIFSYVNDNNYSYISFVNKKITISKRKRGKDKIIRELDLKFDFSYPHTVRLLKEDGNNNLYIDDVYISSIDNCLYSKGLVGYKKISENYQCGYFCFFNIDNSYHYKVPIPGTILNNDLIKINDNEYILKTLSKKDAYYHLSLSIENTEDFILEINNKQFVVNKEQQNEKIDNRYIGTIFLKKNEEIHLKTSKKIDIESLNFIINKEYEVYNNFVNKDGILYSNDIVDNYYLFSEIASYPTLSLDFKIDKKSRYQNFGFIFNVTDFSKEDFQCRYHFNGLMLEYDGHLLNFSQVNYKKEIIYDFRLDIEEGKIHNLKIEYDKKQLYIYFNNTLIKQFFVNSTRNIGRYGFFMSSGAKVEIINFKKEEPLL